MFAFCMIISLTSSLVLSTITPTNTTVSLDLLKLQHDLLKADLRSFSEALQQIQNATTTMTSQIETVMKGVEKLVNAIPRCEDGWLPFSDCCYKIGKTTGITRDEARSKCFNVGAEPIRVRSEQHNNFIVKIMKKVTILYMWIGPTRKQGTLTWPDGTQYTDGYSNFAPSHPTGSTSHDSAYMHEGNKKWGSYPNKNIIQGYGCEKPRINIA